MSYFHTTAIALGGTLWNKPEQQKSKGSAQPQWKHPQQQQQSINVPQGSCALAPAGGVSNADAPGFNQSGISFQSAQSAVSGEENTVNGLDGYITKASVVIKGLNIRDVITADSVEAHILSEYRDGDYEAGTTIALSHF